MAHTSGKWKCTKIVNNSKGIRYYLITTHQPNGITSIGKMDLIRADDEADANARLMVSAPELLEACELALANLSPLYASDHLVIKSLTAAIAKGKGETK